MCLNTGDSPQGPGRLPCLAWALAGSPELTAAPRTCGPELSDTLSELGRHGGWWESSAGSSGPHTFWSASIGAGAPAITASPRKTTEDAS